MNFEDIATFPMEDDDWIVTVLIGGALTFVGFFLFFPILATLGYVVDVMRGAVAGETEPPAFDDWGGLFVDGVKAFVILMVYQLPAMVIGGGLFVGSWLLLLTGSEAGFGLGFLGWLLALGVWSVLGLVFSYVGMAGVVNFAVEDSIGAAFDIGTLKTVVLSGDWLFAWGFYIAMSFVAGIVGMLGITYPFAVFYAYAVGGRAFGEAFAAATGRDTTGTDPTAAEATSADPV